MNGEALLRILADPRRRRARRRPHRGLDGIELMERVPELADLLVVFISGYGRDETIARALERQRAQEQALGEPRQARQEDTMTL